MEINDVRKIFESMGCESEGLNKGYFALEIPADLDYLPVKRKLTEMQKAGVIDYAETMFV